MAEFDSSVVNKIYSLSLSKTKRVDKGLLTAVASISNRQYRHASAEARSKPLSENRRTELIQLALFHKILGQFTHGQVHQIWLHAANALVFPC